MKESLMRERETNTGFLPAYLTVEEAAQEGLNFHVERGWIEEA
jgi:hypothetical protein